MVRYLFVVLALAFTGCTKQEAAEPLCDIAIKSATGAAQGVAETLGCQNLPAVVAAMTKPIQELKICSNAGGQGLVGDLVCPQVAKFVMGTGLEALPADWQCTGGSIGAQAEALILEQCKKSVPF